MQHLAARLGFLHHQRRVGAQLGGHDQQSRREASGRGSRQERVHSGLAERRRRVVQLGLDRAQAAAPPVGAPPVGLLGHQIDSHVRAVTLTLTVRPVAPAPDSLEPQRAVLAGMSPERRGQQPLENPAPLLRRLETLPQQLHNRARARATRRLSFGHGVVHGRAAYYPAAGPAGRRPATTARRTLPAEQPATARLLPSSYHCPSIAVGRSH